MRTICATTLSVMLLTAFCGGAFGAEHCRPTGELQEKAQALADLAVKEGLQGALQFCAYKDGKCIVDVWAGTMTTNAGAAKIDGDTLFPIFSTEKPLLATAVHRSAERGKLEYDTPVCEYWPEFKGGGKENLTVREMMGYRSGLPDCKPGIRWDDFSTMSDWQGMLEWYASCKPEIEPGTKQRYMPRSYGWALGGLLEKAWGRPANDILREQVLIPAGIEKDFCFVCGDDEIPRIATAYNGESFETMNNDIARRSLLPSAWAVSSARGIAKFYNRLCGFDGQPPLISKSTLDAALKPCRHESDPLPDAEGLKKWHMIFGMGYGLWGEADDISRVFGHGGIGGSEGLCDRSQRLVIGYTCNFDNAPPKLREAFYSLVGMRWRYWKDDVNIQDLQMATVAKGNAASAGSVASFCERAQKGDRLTVAFLGGSLSWGANATDPNKTSWRALIGRRLEERYPDARFKFVDAAIGGTGSGLGIFRLERDVIPYKPDIVFVEWLVNDGERKSGDDSSCSYEGIIRHLMERLPGCVPVQVMLPTRGTIEEQDASRLVRWDEQKRTGAAYSLVRADVLGEMRRRHAAGEADLDCMWPAWPALLGDTTHPHDYGYSVYADIIWDQIFEKPSDKSPTMPDEWLFAPKYRHVVRENVASWKDLPKGWHNDACYVRAGTFDFLCSRWQDGLAVAANCVFNPKTCKREPVPGVVEPLRAKFRGEALMLYGESAEWSPKCEVLVDGKRVAERDTADFGRIFAPTAYLVWKIGVTFDADAEHTLEIRPVFADGKPQEFRLGSICVAGRNAAWVSRIDKVVP